MKLGVLSYDKQPLALDGRDWQNFGDHIQSYAMLQILEELNQEMNLTDSIESVSKFELSSYDGEYIFLMMNSFNILTNQLHLTQCVYPISDKIIPCYISYNLASTLTPEIVNFFKQHEPIGCRDEFTMQNMRKNGIKAFLTGCVTALLPRNAVVPKLSEGGKILFIDTPESLEPFVPKEFQGHIERLSALYEIKRTEGEPYLRTDEYEEIYAVAMERFEYYRQHASLIVTRRLHVAAPCMAMGIPVIVTEYDLNERFTWLDKFLPLYSQKDFDKIDWHPTPVYYEKEKKMLKDMIKRRICQEFKQVKDIYDLSSFYENRKKTMPNEMLHRHLLKVPIQHDRDIRYAIWGTVNKAESAKRAIDQYFPNWIMTHAIDLNCEGIFEGIIIEKPEIVDSVTDVDVYIVIPPSAYKSVSNLLKEKNQKYILLDVANCQWSDNISKN